jgi:hypothetical protein
LKKWALLAFLLSPLLTFGQGQGYTNVTGTYAAYANGSVSAGFVNNTGAPQLPLLNGSVFPQANQTNFDSSGNLSFWLADNNQIVPSGTQWRITACQKGGGGPGCCTETITVTGSSQSITSFLNSCPFIAPPAVDPTAVHTNVTSLQSTTGPLSVTCLNNTCYADRESGSTADVQLSACISAAAALSPSGGICDATGYGATTQTIAATVATASNVFLKMSPATVFQPSSSSTDMFSVAENSGIDGLTVNALAVSNYTGNVVKFVNNCQQNDACYLRDFWLANGSNSTNPGTGTAILVQGNSAGTVNMSTVHIGPGQIVGFQNGIYLQSLGPAGVGFVNDTAVSTVKITNAVNCINLYSDPGDVYGNTFSQVSCEAGAGNISGAIGYWSHGVSGTVNQKANQFIGGNIWDYGNGSSTQYPYVLDSHTSEAFIQTSIPVGNNGVQTDAGTSDQIWNLNYPLKIQQLGIGCLILEPAGSPDVLYSIYNNGTNIVVGNGSSCPGSNPVEIDSAGDINPSGNVNVGTAGSPNYIFINPATGGGTKWYIDNTGTLLRISNGLTGPGTNPVSVDPNGNLDIPSGAEYLYNGAQINFTNLAGSASTAQLPNSAAQVDSTTPTSGIVACVKTIGPPVVLGYCSTIVGSGGSCTCN